MPNSEKTVAIMMTREKVTEALATLDELEDINGGRLPGRYVSLARTALEEADSWLWRSLDVKEGE